MSPYEGFFSTGGIYIAVSHNISFTTITPRENHEIGLLVAQTRVWFLDSFLPW